jgi:chromosomal replication initiator protein
MRESRSSAQGVWEEVLRALGKKAARPSFQSSIKQVKVKGIREDTLELLVGTEFARDWLEKRGAKAIEGALEQVLGRPGRVRFELAQIGLELGEGEAGGEQERRLAPRRVKAAPPPSTPLNPKYTFENFVVGKGNQFAQAAATAVAQQPGKSYNPLFVYSGVGLGKTHLMQAIGNQVRATRPDLRVEYMSGDAFSFDMVSSIRDGRFTSFRTRHREVDVWLVDDIQFIAAKERTEAEFFHVFNTLYELGRQVVITSDRAPKELQVMEDRLRSRFEWGLIADMKPPDLETRVAILEKKAAAEQVAVPEEVLKYIARVVKSNIRVLEGALISVLAAASLTKSEITLALAAEQLQNHSVEATQAPLTIPQVQAVVAEHFHLTVPELMARRRTREVVFPRQVAMYLCRELLNSSYPSIARAFGGKDHSTVMHACSRIRDSMHDESLHALVYELGARLRAGG